jgi:hypothetical protein
MNFTFGIITAGSDPTISTIATTIRELCIPNYEIIVVGNCNLKANDIKVLDFDESKKRSWITKKKNMITEAASYENIVYLHDYIAFDKDWYKGFKLFGNDFKVVTNIILDSKGNRFRDWVVEYKGEVRFIPYDVTDLSRFMYISGAYFVAKKDFMLANPLNEKLSWGEGEDCEWSYRVRNITDFKINPHSKVLFIKLKQNNTIYASLNDIAEMRKL